MSSEAKQWLDRQLRTDGSAHARVKGARRAVLERIALAVDPDGRGARRSLRQLATDTGYDRRTIQRALRTLEGDDLIQRHIGCACDDCRTARAGVVVFDLRMREPEALVPGQLLLCPPGSGGGGILPPNTRSGGRRGAAPRGGVVPPLNDLKTNFSREEPSLPSLSGRSSRDRRPRRSRDQRDEQRRRMARPIERHDVPVMACPAPPGTDALLDEQWAPVRGRLASSIAETTFTVWLAPLHLHAAGDGWLTVGAPADLAQWIHHRFAPLLQAAAGPVQIVIEPCDAAAHQPAPAPVELAQEAMA